MVAESAV